MTQMKRAGRRSVLTRRDAHRFCADLITAARERETTCRSVAFGSSALALGLTRRDDVGALIDNAFVSSIGNPRLRLTIASHEDVPVLPPTHWAMTWIEARVEVPASIVYPYRLFFDRVVGTVFVLDQVSGEGIVWLRHPAEIDMRSMLTPFRIMLSWLANLQDAELLHASATVIDGRAFAFCGPSGSGKSTLALALAGMGLPIISDDCLLLENGSAYAVFSRAKLDPAAADRFGFPRPPDWNEGLTLPTKQVISIAGTDDFMPSAPLGLIGVPATGFRSAASYRLPSRRAYAMVSKDSLRELNGGATRNRLRIARAIKKHGAHRLLLSPSSAENRDMIVALAGGAE